MYILLPGPCFTFFSLLWLVTTILFIFLSFVFFFLRLYFHSILIQLFKTKGFMLSLIQDTGMQYIQFTALLHVFWLMKWLSFLLFIVCLLTQTHTYNPHLFASFPDYIEQSTTTAACHISFICLINNTKKNCRTELEKRLPWLGIKEKLDEGDNKSVVTAVSAGVTDGERMAPDSMENPE